MRRPGPIAATLALAAITSAWVMAGPVPAAPVRQDQQPTFRSGVDVVSVDVSVRDRNSAITKLTAKDFEILDNGVPQQIFDVSYGKLPIDVTLGLDVSQSVTGALLDQLRKSVRQLMVDLGKDDRLKLMTFNARITRLIDLTTDASAVDAALKRASALGGTSVLDTVSVALIAATEPDRRQLVMLFTDGNDSNSISDEPALIDVARRTHAALDVVLAGPKASAASAAAQSIGLLLPGESINLALPNESRSPVRAELFLTYPSVLVRLARETGGQVLPIQDGEDLTSTFRRLLDEFRSSYVIHFSPKGVEKAGFHALTVHVIGRQGLDIRARHGYFGT